VLTPSQRGRGLQSYFSPYPPDPLTNYSVYFITKQGSTWYARSVIVRQTPFDLQSYYIQNEIPFQLQPGGNVPNVAGANPPIRLVTPFLETDPDLAVRAIVIEASAPGPTPGTIGCTRRVTVYPAYSQFSGIPTAGNAIFQSIDIPIDWNSRLLGQPLAGVDILFGVPIRTHQ
jgi:hypothetical protein